MTNLIVFTERICYQYFVIVCIKNTYLDEYSEFYYSNNKETIEYSFLTSDLAINLKDYSDTKIFESSDEYYIYQKSRSDTTQLSSEGGYYNSLIKVKYNKPNFLPNPTNQHKNNFFMFHKFLTNILINYHLPSKKLSTLSDSYEHYTHKEGI